MSCQGVVDRCSRRPLCPCFQRWDAEAWVPELMVVYGGRLSRTRAGVEDLVGAVKDASRRYIVRTAVGIRRAARRLI